MSSDFCKHGCVRRYLAFLAIITTVVVFLLCADWGRQKFWGMAETSGNADVYGRFNNTSSRLAIREQTKAVLLLTYMRTGSSLTGELLQRLPGAFYVFEPLRTLYETDRLPGKYKVADVHIETLRGWLTCDFSRIYLKSFDDFTFLALGKETKHLNECRRHSPPGMAPKDVFFQCVEALRQRCLNSSIRVVKTIRTPMSKALSLSKVVDNLKVIHLIRDPRSVAASKRIACGALDLISCAEQYCQQVTQDCKIKLHFPENSVLDVKYEDIASRPLTAVRRMFSFLGRTLPAKVAEFAIAVTVGGNRSECEVCRQVWQIGDRSDSSLDHIDSWKRVIKPAFVSKLQTVCNHMMDAHGYRIIQYQHNASFVT